MFQHVDVVIAFVVLMLVASLFITAATQGVIGLLGLRGANLRRSLADLLETAYPDQETRHWSKEIAGRVLRHPTVSDSIFSHFRVRAERLPFLPPETAGKLQGISASIPLLPWIMGGVGGFFLTPIAVAIAKGLFGAVLCQYTDVLAGYVSAINFCDHPWRTGLVVGAILGGLLSRWRVAASIRVEELPAALEKLAEPLPGTLPDPAQRAMLRIAWSEKEPGGRARAGEVGEPIHSKPYFDEGIAGRSSKVSLQNQNLFAGAADFDEGIVRHAEPMYFDEGIAGRSSKVSLQNQNLFAGAADFDEGIVRHAEPMEPEGSVAVEVENAAAQGKEPEPECIPATGELTTDATSPEPQQEGLRAGFDLMMDKASQRFTVEARLVTVVLSCIFAFGAHFDAVRLLQSMSQGAELRAQLAATAAGIDKQAEQLPRSKQSARTVVPEVYRQAMVPILRTGSVETSGNNGGSDAKPLSAKRKGRTKEREKTGATATPTEDRVTAGAKSKAMHDLESAKRKGRTKEREKTGATATPTEDRVTAGAKSKAMHDLETVPGFASREDADSWLRMTLVGNPARESLAAAYQQEVNVELVSDSDKLIDQSASLKSELARSQFKLFQDERGSAQSSSTLPSLLITIAMLSLGAAFWYNTLRNLASLRPQLAMKQDRERSSRDNV